MTRGFNFNSIPVARLKRTAFDLSHEFKFSAPMGKLIPIYCQEALPGDSFKISVAELTRFMALQSPMMQRVDVRFEFFKVPLRLIWKDVETFFTGGQDGTETPTAPAINLGGLMSEGGTYDLYDSLSTGKLLDYLGYPLPYKLTAEGTWQKIDLDDLQPFSAETLSTLPLNAYHCIYNNFYRDQNLIDETPLADESQVYSGDDLQDLGDAGYFELHKRAWKKDYFTSALAYPQRGQSVAVGLSGNAPVNVPGGQKLSLDAINNPQVGDEFLQYAAPADPQEAGIKGLSTIVDLNKDNGQIYIGAGSEYTGNQITGILGKTGFDLEGEADLSGASAISIIALRTAFKLQQFLERNNIAGARMVESDLAHFGVRGSDARMQRPEIIGRFTMPVTVSPVESTADTEGAAVGQLAGQAKSVGGSKTFRTFCNERCIIMGLMSVMPQASYSQGVSRMWTRKDKFDYFWPEFQAIGEQAVKNRELYLDYEGNSDPDGDFGYQSRYSDYKFNADRVAGDLRTNLSYWHMGRLFTQAPGLNKSFIECDPTDRIFAVQDELSDQHLVCDLWLNVKAVRPMAKYSTPRLS